MFYGPDTLENRIYRHILQCTESNIAQQRDRDFVVDDPGAILVVEIRRDNRANAEQEVAALIDDWKAHSTPSDWAYGSLPNSMFQEKNPGGFRDKTGLMLDKAAIMALAYLKLHKASGEARFLNAAEAIGQTLSKRQRPNGSWPFRVDPKTEKVIEEYSSSVIYAVMLFEELDAANGNHRYKKHRDLTWNWLLDGPIKTKEF